MFLDMSFCVLFSIVAVGEVPPPALALTGCDRGNVMGVPPQPDFPPDCVKALAECRGDLLASEMLARGEPSFESLARVGYSFPGTASLGLPLAQEEAGVLWNGTIIVPGRTADGRRVPRLFVPLLGTPLLPWGGDVPVRRKLVTEGPLRVVVERTSGSIHARETTLVAPGGDPNGCLHVRFRFENRSETAQSIHFALATLIREFGPFPWEGKGDKLTICPEKPALDPGTGVAAVGSHAIVRGPRHLKFSTDGRQSTIHCDHVIAPGESRVLDFTVPLGDVSPDQLVKTSDFDAAFDRAGEVWAKVFGQATSLSLPEPRLQRLYRSALAQLLIAADGDIIPYGSFPGVYDREVLGLEETWEMEALASFGFGAEAVNLLRGTYFTPRHLNKRTKHHQYRNGLTAQVAWRIYELTRDRNLSALALEVLLPLAEWTRQSRRCSGDGTEPGAPLHAGLLPKHLYGGDLQQPCHALYSNFTCWRGLRDTALFLADRGRKQESQDLLAEAAAYRKRILEVCDRIAKREADPPFLPFRLEESAAVPTSGEYYQLFGPLVLETGCLPRGGPLQKLVVEAIEKGPRLVARQARFGEPLGLDAHYTRGLMAEWLRAGRRKDFLMGFYCQQALACDRDVFSCPEVMPIFFTAKDRRDEELRRLSGARRTDPCAAGPATFLLHLRDALILEERDDDDLHTGRLIVAAGIPQAWLRPGAVIAAGPIATAYGPVTFSLECSAGEKGRLAIDLSHKNRPREVVLRLPGRPDQQILKSRTDFKY
jgi:hypothetical protein